MQIFRQVLVHLHVLTIQVFDANHPIFRHQLARKLVQNVPLTARNSLVAPLQLGSRCLVLLRIVALRILNPFTGKLALIQRHTLIEF